MAKAQVRDHYSNKAYGSVTESAANTLTFSEIQTNISIFEKVAWVINRIEWYLSATELAKLTGSGDAAQFALTASDQISNLDLSNASVIDMMQLSHKEHSAVGWQEIELPFTRDFSGLPGGGVIIAPRPLYVGAVGTSLASALTVETRLFFQQMVMSPDEYLELIDFYRIVS